MRAFSRMAARITSSVSGFMKNMFAGLGYRAARLFASQRGPLGDGRATPQETARHGARGRCADGAKHRAADYIAASHCTIASRERIEREARRPAEGEHERDRP